MTLCIGFSALCLFGITNPKRFSQQQKIEVSRVELVCFVLPVYVTRWATAWSYPQGSRGVVRPVQWAGRGWPRAVPYARLRWGRCCGVCTGLGPWLVARFGVFCGQLRSLSETAIIHHHSLETPINQLLRRLAGFWPTNTTFHIRPPPRAGWASKAFITEEVVIVATPIPLCPCNGGTL